MMKKIIFSLCIAIVASLSGTYVNASKTNSDIFYGRTLTGTYIRIMSNYESLNCINLTGCEDVCGYELLPAGWGIIPSSFTNEEAQDWLLEGYIRPLPGRYGIYLLYD